MATWMSDVNKSPVSLSASLSHSLCLSLFSLAFCLCLHRLFCALLCALSLLCDDGSVAAGRNIVDQHHPLQGQRQVNCTVAEKKTVPLWSFIPAHFFWNVRLIPFSRASAERERARVWIATPFSPDISKSAVVSVSFGAD